MAAQPQEFGTGLRAHLEGRTEPEPVPELVPERPLTAPPTRVELGEQSRLFAAAEAELAYRERRMAEQEAALAAEASKLALKQRELERAHLDSTSVRELLRARTEQNAELVWKSFEQALGAERPDGSADVETRLWAACALLAEAYEDAPTVAKPSQDELSERRARRDVGA